MKRIRNWVKFYSAFVLVTIVMQLIKPKPVLDIVQILFFGLALAFLIEVFYKSIFNTKKAKKNLKELGGINNE